MLTTQVVEGPRYRNPYDEAHPLPDPAEEAARVEARLFEIEQRKAEAAAVAQERARKRFEAAQTKIRNERLKKQVEAEMEAKAMEEIQRRKNAVLLGRG